MTNSELTSFGGALPHMASPIASSGDKNTIPTGSDNSTDTTTSVKYGHPLKMSLPLDENGVPVPRKDLNGIYYMLSQITHYLMAGGKVPWSQAEASAIGGYPQGAEVAYNGTVYKSLSDSNVATPTDTTKWAVVAYLPTAGGTMTGTITSSPATALRKNADDGYLEILGGSSAAKGAALQLAGKDYEGSAVPAGGFDLQTKSPDGSTSPALRGLPDGTLSWNGKNVVRSVNGVNANAAGNVTIAGWPNYGGRVAISGNSYTAPSNGWIVVAHNQLGGTRGEVKIGGFQVFSSNVSSQSAVVNVDTTSMIPVKSGNTITFTNIQDKHFIPAV